MNPNRAMLVAAVPVVVAVAVLSSCAGPGSTNKHAQPWNDAPVVGSADVGPAHIVAMPDGFNNLAWKCIKGTHSGFVVTYHGDSRYGTASHFIDPTLCP